jgi:hypothetical protein
MARQESGPLKIGDDWPGIFMRGDDALSTANTLRTIADHIEDPAVREGAVTFLKELADALYECRVERRDAA